MSQVTEQSVRFQTALASIKLIQASAVLDLTEDDFDFLTSNKVWIATDRSRARRCVEACVYGDRKSGSAGMPRPISYAVFCLKKKKRSSTARRGCSWRRIGRSRATPSLGCRPLRRSYLGSHAPCYSGADPS